jgi:hypothetical protein
MTALFPTFGSLLKRAKDFLACDTRDIWRHICNVIEADEQRYISQCQAKGITPYLF